MVDIEHTAPIAGALNAFNEHFVRAEGPNGEVVIAWNGPGEIPEELIPHAIELAASTELNQQRVAAAEWERREQEEAAAEAERRARLAQEDAARARAEADAARALRFSDGGCPADVEQNKVNVAIAGQSGAGKSSTVNALVGAEVAAVGVIETTEQRASYPMPLSPVMLFDLPGSGTPAHPIDSYFHEQALRYYDGVIIMTHNRFKQEDYEIARQLATEGVPFRLARNMAATAVETNQRVNGMSEAATLQSIRDYLITYQHTLAEETGNRAIEGQEVFVVDSFDLTAFDGAKMIEWAVATVKK